MWLGWRKRPPRKSESGSDGWDSIKRATLKPARCIADTASYRGGEIGNERHLGVMKRGAWRSLKRTTEGME